MIMYFRSAASLERATYAVAAHDIDGKMLQKDRHCMFIPYKPHWRGSEQKLRDGDVLG